MTVGYGGDASTVALSIDHGKTVAVKLPSGAADGCEECPVMLGARSGPRGVQLHRYGGVIYQLLLQRFALAESPAPVPTVGPALDLLGAAAPFEAAGDGEGLSVAPTPGLGMAFAIEVAVTARGSGYLFARTDVTGAVRQAALYRRLAAAACARAPSPLTHPDRQAIGPAAPVLL